MNPSIHQFSHTSTTESVELNSVRNPSFPDTQLKTPVCPLPSLQHRISINQVTTLPRCLSEDLADYQESGIAGIGLSWRKLSQYGLRRGMRKVQESRMPISSLGCIGGFTGENGYPIKEVLCDARKMIRIAGQLRTGTVTVVTGALSGHIRSHANRIVVDCLKELVPLAALYGVQLALQPMHPMFAKNWSFLHSLDDCQLILDRVRDSRLKIAFGTYHLWQEPSLLSRLEELTPRIGLVQLADWGDSPRDDHDRLLPGEGRLPITEVMRTLEGNRYSGWYELEVWSRDLWKQDHRDLMRSCVSVRDKLSRALFPV